MDSLSYDQREKFIDRIEGFFGSLTSIRWHDVSDDDLIKMYACLVDSKMIKPIK